MRVAVVDLGTNSTRLLVADVAPDGTISEIERRSTVTRLGDGVDAHGALAREAMDRVHTALAEYRAVIGELGAERTTGVLTSAARDAANGARFADEVRERHGLAAEILSGEAEARLTYLGAISDREPPAEPTVVIDVGGGSTELVVGAGREILAHVSTQVGVVRQTERHLRHDPPRAEEIAALREEAAATFAPHAAAAGARRGIAVAGTPTSCAAMAQRLEPYDPARVHGFVLARTRLDELLAGVAAMPLAERRRVPGLHPDRAPTIVAGIAILLEAVAAHGLDEIEASEHDLLRGAALRCTGLAG